MATRMGQADYFAPPSQVVLQAKRLGIYALLLKAMVLRGKAHRYQLMP